MKKTWFSALAIIGMMIVGCYEITEEIVISKKGSGTYVTRMDMSPMIQLMQSMAGEEELSKNGLDKNLDTVIHLRDVMDTIKDISDEERRLMNDGSMKLRVNIKESIFKADIDFPFKNLDDLQMLMSGVGTSGMGAAFKKAFAGPDSTQSGAAVQDQGLDQINNVFDVTVNKHIIQRKLNQEKYNALMAKPEMEQAKMMIGNGFEILYTTIIRLPNPVKKFDSPFIKLSDDKKTVTIKYDMMKIFESPEKFSYSIEY